MRLYNPFGAKKSFDCVQRKVLHPALVNVVQHREPEAFQVGMFVDVGLQGLCLDVFFGLGFDGDNALFGLDSEVDLHLGFVGGLVEGGNLDAGELLVDVALRESAFELLENVVADQHLGCGDVSHGPE